MPPPWPDDSAAARADLAACRGALRQGSRSFHAASRLLPGRVAAPAAALYAFCREADDLVDRGPAGPGLALARERLARAAEGRPLDHPADRALARVLRRHGVPRALPEALIEGLAWDASGRRCGTLPDLLAYAARVAGSVGAMTALLMGAREEAALSRAADLGCAMQLTNVARDVAEDAAAGRLYLPTDWMREAGLDPEAWLAAPRGGPALASVVSRLLDAAGPLYARGLAGLPLLPADCRPGVAAAAGLYAAIGDAVRRSDSAGAGFGLRARTGRGERLALLARAGVALLAREGPATRGPALAETRFLVRAGLEAPPPLARARPHGAAWWDAGARLAWLVETMTRVEARRRAGEGGRCAT